MFEISRRIFGPPGSIGLQATTPPEQIPPKVESVGPERWGDYTHLRIPAVEILASMGFTTEGLFDVRRVEFYLPEIFHRNRTLLLPTIIDGVEGDRNSRQLYEQRRLFHWSALPEWGQKCVGKILEQKAAALIAEGTRALAKGPNRRDALRALDNTYDPQKLALCLGLGSTVCYVDALRLLDVAKENRPDDVSIQRGMNSDLFMKVTTLSLTSPGIGSTHALRTFEHVMPLMLRAMIIEDFLTIRGIDIPSKNREELLGETKEPWNVLGSKRIRNYLAIKCFCENNGLDETTERSALVEFARASDVQRVLRARFLGPEETSIPAPRSASAETTPSATEAQLMAGLHLAIEEHLPNEDSSRNARRFARLIRKGILNYQDAIAGLKDGRSSQNIMDSAYERLRRTTQADMPPESNTATIPQPREEQGQSFSPNSRFSIQYWSNGSRSPFTRWLAGLSDAKVVDGIEERLRKAEEGTLGDIRPIARTGNRVYEMRIGHGPGYRVYFRFSSGRVLEVISGGTKDEQDEDIEWLARIF